ncbi:pimeloyl-ACP methyl ester esterase BioH [Erwinia tracheiphila]|uniref:Pimeloyl-[acyl-carrier protein] methyl ester esterase n=1 Tax=Erwinia tracheiphila TaxID=65700 RepID=A0A0M2KIT4_9GAMM|nr:pimeloyl-ACP methyl ester esterase BioH [Erwinia tracheiphila]AXF78010.1 pimeloyl-[acyl-carrier protein] methyl ester esterase [Erwinia tracheiphila]EOS95406.1 carboxylesterase (Biotin synthesis protein BioH) [Erwinia tracheiphila PSU-1]KKF37148.1 carboxylesterase [Erwinia tracheiphila]UIA83275.1 pimeloyl-ACP methyl ester esterase BioH [Erwinia tracheiphila]UIA88535.1 pimeloyl-ACP methyl ester esterase BioH [Erwinia tracheiphila]
MTQLYWQTIGSGDRELVMLHGWGLNAEVWHDIIDRLSPHFRLHLVDLPGYGRSRGFPPLSVKEMAAALLPQAPEWALWLGWSLGGLVASQLALDHPQRVSGLISVASSPCFTAGPDWPGIRPETLCQFQQQLSEDFQRTVERFLALQTMGSETARQDVRQLKNVVLSHPAPDIAVLNGGLEILRTVDLRDEMTALRVPLLRIYGALDGLVPRGIAALLDARQPHSESVIIEKAAHAPFISHAESFCEKLVDFSINILK